MSTEVLRYASFRSTVYAAEKCAELDGFYSLTDRSCYYNGSKGGTLCRYFVNLKCYAYVDTSYTASTCANIGGFFTTFHTQREVVGNFCYYRHFNCTLHAANGQCYRFKTLVNTQSECDANDGYYQHGYCYYECPNSKYLVDDRCYDVRSTEYSRDDCETAGGHYAHNHCYIGPCNHFPVNDHCYRYRTQAYSNSTCTNVGGYYAAESVPPYDRYCYYTSFQCPYHAVNGQCYTRSSNQSQTMCETVPDSYYDTGNNTCYYYCTEMPSLGQCFAGASSSFTRETCDAIGGVYSNRKCFFITTYCPAFKANNGQCYANRSVTLSCDSCRNIGGHYENSSCYYQPNNKCRAHRIDGQCYSMRSSNSRGLCNTMGGLFRDRHCYYQRSTCSTSYYRNCTCYESASQSKTAGTCANIGGYYDFAIRLCFYSSITCPYYTRNSQCYRYRSVDFSPETCSSVRGYGIRGQSEHGRNVYTCYYNEFNCSRWLNDQCYSRFSSSYNKGTCIAIGGYYSEDNQGCYFNSFHCRIPLAGQCYDRSYEDWSRSECDEAVGYYASHNRQCYVSTYYCPYVVGSYRKCFSYESASYDCSSCRLLDGLAYSGSCYHNTENCSEPLFLAGNGQCYENRTSARTKAECSLMPGEAFHDEDGNMCYFSTGSCSPGHYVHCQCFIHRSTVYTADSCSNFGGVYVNGRCYYNSSHCPHRYHSVNGQCYRRFDRYSQSTCRNIGGYYTHEHPANATTQSSTGAGTCYYNSFNCSGFTVDRRHCYSNRSATYSRATCRNIGGVYGFADSDGQYQTDDRNDGRRMYSPAADRPERSRTYFCLYNVFSCVG